MRVIIFDEELLFSEALAVLFSRLGHEVLGCPTTADDLLQLAEVTSADACLASTNSTAESDIDVIRRLRAARPDVAIVALGTSADLVSLTQTLEAGADGVCLKLDGISEIETVMQRCVRGRQEGQRPREATWSHTATAAARRKGSGDRSVAMTPKERLVLELLIHGASTGKIAAELGVGEATIRTHLQHLFTKFGVHSRLALVAHAVRTQAVRFVEPRRAAPMQMLEAS